MSETSDSAEVETETKLHNVTANARTRASDQRAARGTKTEEKREREGRSWRTRERCVRAYTSSYKRRRRAERETEGKKGTCCVTQTHIHVQACECIAWRDASVCATVTVNVCREAYPPVERGADESVELSAHPTPNPPETNPSYRDEPPPHYSSLAFPSSTADPLLHAPLCPSLAHFSLHAVP